MYWRSTGTSHVEALTLNFLREPCAPELRPYLSEAPVTTDIGPVESMTVACILDEEQPALNLSIWNRADLPDNNTRPRVAERIAAVLESMAPMWHNPIAMTVNEWFGIGPDGARCQTIRRPAQRSRRQLHGFWTLPELSRKLFQDVAASTNGLTGSCATAHNRVMWWC